MERQAALADQPRLHPRGGAGEVDPPAAPRQLVADRQRREDVAAGAAAGEQHAGRGRGVRRGAHQPCSERLSSTPQAVIETTSDEPP